MDYLSFGDEIYIGGFLYLGVNDWLNDLVCGLADSLGLVGVFGVNEHSSKHVMSVLRLSAENNRCLLYKSMRFGF